MENYVKDLIIYGSNYGSVGARTALCCSVFAAIAIVAHFNVLTKFVLDPGNCHGPSTVPEGPDAGGVDAIGSVLPHKRHRRAEVAVATLFACAK